MVELNYSSTKGRQIYEKGCHYEGFTLEQVYNNPSSNKQVAYDKCVDEFLNTEDSAAFSICSHNNFMFTCSWVGKLDGEGIMRYETANNSYLVWLER